MRPDPHFKTAQILTFNFGEAVTTIRVEFEDRQSGADMVITNMTTLPEKHRGRGRGSWSLNVLLGWAFKEGLTNIQAVQVQRQSEAFWIKNGFTSLGNITNDFLYCPTKKPASH